MDGDQKTTRYYRIDDLPKELDAELRAVADACEMSVTGVVSSILHGVDLRSAVIAGQMVASKFSASETGALGLHLPVELKDACRKVSEETGVRLGAVVRLVLMSLEGRIGTAALDGKRQLLAAARD